jgi:hypothetical protein
VQGPAAARRDDPLGGLVVRVQRVSGRIVDLHHHPRPARREEADHALALAAVRLPHPAPNHQHLDTEPTHRGREPADHRPNLDWTEFDHGPHVELDPVPLRAPARLAVSLEVPYPLDRVQEHLLELRERHDLPLLVAHGGQVAHLGEREDALLPGIRTRRSAEQVDILRRRQSLELEVREPP